jgi:prophage regulatory protein
MQTQQIIKRPDVEKLTGLSRSSIYRLAANGEFPHPVKIGPRAVGWINSEIESWINHRIAARDGKGAQ